MLLSAKLTLPSVWGLYMGAVEKSEFEPNEKRMTNDHTRTGLNDATTLDSTLSFSLDDYDEIAHFFQTGKFMRVSDVEAAFLLIY